MTGTIRAVDSALLGAISLYFMASFTTQAGIEGFAIGCVTMLSFLWITIILEDNS